MVTKVTDLKYLRNIGFQLTRLNSTSRYIMQSPTCMSNTHDRSITHKLAKMSFDQFFDLTAGVFFYNM